MSCNTRIKLIAVTALALVMSLAAPAHAQRGGRGGGNARPSGRPRTVVTRPVVVAPYFAPYYSPFYQPFYDPFFFGFYSWGYPGFYMPAAFYGGSAVEASAARIQVTPKETEVYVDGYLAGIVDDFDGMSQRLRVAPGEHVIDLYLDGHKRVTQTIMFTRGETYRIRHTMEALTAGESAPDKPAPRPGAAAAPARAEFDAFGQPLGRPSSVAAIVAGAARLTIRVQPGDASISVDGEHWQTSGGERLELQVNPGEHRIEVEKDGYQPFTTTVRVKAGDAAPINISLTKSGDE